jgi:hypothetical protein
MNKLATFRCVLLTGAILACAAFSGCYRHVVKASGPTSKSYDVYEPNVPDDQIDGVIFGSGKKKSKN